MHPQQRQLQNLLMLARNHNFLTTATANYGGDFSACLKKDNFHAAQFHPEKSSKAGQQLLKNFLDWQSWLKARSKALLLDRLMVKVVMPIF